MCNSRCRPSAEKDTWESCVGVDHPPKSVHHPPNCTILFSLSPRRTWGTPGSRSPPQRRRPGRRSRSPQQRRRPTRRSRSPRPRGRQRRQATTTTTQCTWYVPKPRVAVDPSERGVPLHSCNVPRPPLLLPSSPWAIGGTGRSSSPWSRRSIVTAGGNVVATHLCRCCGQREIPLGTEVARTQSIQCLHGGQSALCCQSTWQTSRCRYASATNAWSSCRRGKNLASHHLATPEAVETSREQTIRPSSAKSRQTAGRVESLGETRYFPKGTYARGHSRLLRST